MAANTKNVVIDALADIVTRLPREQAQELGVSGDQSVAVKHQRQNVIRQNDGADEYRYQQNGRRLEKVFHGEDLIPDAWRVIALQD